MKTRRRHQQIIPPSVGSWMDGWEPHTWYLVEVKYSASNLLHRSLYYSGFLSKEGPAGYNVLVPLNGPSYEDGPAGIQNVYYLKVIRRLFSEKEANTMSPK